MEKSTIKFDFHKNPKNAFSNQQDAYHVRINDNQIVTLDEICEVLEQSTTVTRADIHAVVIGIKDILRAELASGNAVNLDGICKIEPQLGTIDGVCTGKESGGQITLKGLKALPSKSLVDDVRIRLKPCERQRVLHSADLNEEEIRQALKAYFADHTYITRAELESYLGVTRYKANRYLNLCVERGYLSHPGGAHSPLYYPVAGCLEVD